MKRKRGFRKTFLQHKAFNYLILAVGIIFLYIMIWLGVGFITIKRIECVSQFGTCNKIIDSKFDSLVGEKYLKAVSKLKNIVGEEALIEKYSFQYTPNGVRIDIIERQARFALAKSDSELKALVDSSGLVLGFTESTQLPTVVNDNFQLSEGKVTNKVLFALEVMHLVNLSYAVTIGKIDDGSSLSIELPKAIKVIFPLEGDIEVLIGSMILIYNDLTNQFGSKLNTHAQIIDTIDLRFKNPVLN